jgi:hypothetical protein
MTNTPRRPADGSKEIADAIGYAARHLGTSDAATPMGALEFVGSAIAESGDADKLGDIASALEKVAESAPDPSQALADIGAMIEQSGTTNALALDDIGRALEMVARGLFAIAKAIDQAGASNNKY